MPSLLVICTAVRLVGDGLVGDGPVADGPRSHEHTDARVVTSACRPIALGEDADACRADACTTSASSFASKKERWLAEKSIRSEHTPDGSRRVPHAVAPVFAHNLRTREIAILDGPGALPPEQADRFFRCWFTGDHTDVPDVLVARVVHTARTFDVRHVKIVSSYRAPKYNLSLVKKGREVARDSEHTRGQAIDFQLVGVPVRRVYDHLLRAHPGGVGFYPVSEFVHVDIGKKRTWQGT